MFKRDWIVFSILAVFSAFITMFSIFYTTADGKQIVWLVAIAAVAITGTIVYLVYLLYAQSKQRFARLLQHEKFNAEKSYVFKNDELYFDFTNKLVANNYLATKPIFPFSDIIGYRFETFRISGESHAEQVEELSDDERFVSIVLTVKKPEREFEFFYIPMFEVKVSNADIGETIESISDELLEKYPDFKDVVALQADVDAILAMNKNR